MGELLKIKLYGESLKIHRIGFKAKYVARFKAVIKSMHEPIEEILLDVNFYQNLGISDIQSIQDLVCNSFGGLINNSKSQIEIWSGRKRLVKLKLEAIVRSGTLFPLYQIEVNQMDDETVEKGLFFEEREVGLIGIYEINTDDCFKIDLLTFYILKMKDSNIELLNSIVYDHKKLVEIKSDTLVTHQRCFKQY